MNLRKTFEKLMVAISFAEAGEYDTARDIMKRKEELKRAERAPAARKTASQRKDLRPPSMHT